MLGMQTGSDAQQAVLSLRVHHKYIEAAAKTQQIKQVERATRKSKLIPTNAHQRLPHGRQAAGCQVCYPLAGMEELGLCGSKPFDCHISLILELSTSIYAGRSSMVGDLPQHLLTNRMLRRMRDTSKGEVIPSLQPRCSHAVATELHN